MSIQAIAWVFSQEIRPSTAKFVLVALVNYINDDSTAWCPISRLSEITSQDRKTVMHALSKLEEQGHITDTGNRVGATGQIKLYQVRVPDAVLLRKSKSTALGGKQYQSSRQRVPVLPSNSTKYGTRSLSDPLLSVINHGDEKRTNNTIPIGEHLAKLKASVKK